MVHYGLEVDVKQTSKQEKKVEESKKEDIKKK